MCVCVYMCVRACVLAYAVVSVAKQVNQVSSYLLVPWLSPSFWLVLPVGPESNKKPIPAPPLFLLLAARSKEGCLEGVWSILLSLEVAGEGAGRWG
jgi:hypothetical protein